MKFTDWFTQHEDTDIRARVRAVMHVRMTDAEREKARAYLERYLALHPARSSRSVSSYALLLHPMPLIASLLIVVVSGASIVGAAENALPGNALYAVKVNINEEVRLALAATPEEKAAVTLGRAERRLQELAALHERGEVDDALRDEIDERLDAHVHEAEVTSTEIDEARALDIEHRVVALLRAHEALVTPGEIGGFDEPRIDVARVAAAEAGDASLAMTTDEPLPATMMMAMEAPVDSRVATFAVEEASQPAAETSLAIEVPSAKRGAAPLISEKALTRLERTARERIDSLEKLLVREEKQNEKRDEKRENRRDTSILTLGLASAKDALANAMSARDNGNLLDASALFNSAIRFAIDAREAYAEAHRTNDDAREQRDDDRNGTNSRDDEPGDDRSGRSRERNDK